MAFDQYRIENSDSSAGGLFPPNTSRELYADRSLAVAVAVKSISDPTCQAVRVVHVPTGEVVFQTTAPERR